MVFGLFRKHVVCFFTTALLAHSWATNTHDNSATMQPVPLTLAALEKLHLRTRARCELLALRADNLLPAHIPAASSAKLRLGPLSANDAVALLAEAGLYDLAVTVARAHGLPLEGVVASLTDRAVHLTVEGESSSMAVSGLWRTFNDHSLPRCFCVLGWVVILKANAKVLQLRRQQASGFGRHQWRERQQ